MSRQRNRRVRRRRYTQEFQPEKFELPGPLRILTNPKLFVFIGLLMATALLVSVLPLNIRANLNRQNNDVKDAAVEEEAVPTPNPAVTPTVKRYTASPDLAIDLNRRYTATIKTEKGDIQIELYAKDAPLAVNSFVFLAREGYYNCTPFLQLVTNRDGSRFVAQAGDPTATGNGTPGYSLPIEQNSRAFSKGAVGTGGSAAESAGGQFFISYGDYPSLNGKYTIFGQVTSGMNVLERLILQEIQKQGGAGDKIVSIEISES